MYGRQPHPALSAALLWLVAACGLGAQSAATLNGRVEDPSGAAVAGAELTLRNPLTGYQQHVLTAAGGTFSIANIPYQDYVLVVRKPGFADKSMPVSLRSGVPVEVTVSLALAEVAGSVAVTRLRRAPNWWTRKPQAPARS